MSEAAATPTGSRPTVAAIWRYPVKSMLGEQLDASEVGERGLAGDRGYALVDVESGNIVSAKSPRRWGQLFECRAEFLEPPDTDGKLPPVLVTLPDGTSVRSDDHDADDALSLAFGRTVRLASQAPSELIIEELPVSGKGEVDDRVGAERQGQIALLAPPGTFFDAAPVHVVTTSTLAALAAVYPSGRFDPRRFRPNVVIEDAADGFVENAWVGNTMAIGARVALDILLSVPRCVMTTLPQGDLPADRGILRTIASENRFDIPGLGPSSCVGVYGIVTTGGTVAAGDAVELTPA
jgi:uncharacterized protein